MITTPTVLILGAGSSLMYGFPSGARLRKQILQRLSSGGSEMRRTYESMGFNKHAVQVFHDALLKSGTESVDALLEHRTDLLTIGKTAIAEALIPCENEAALFNAKRDWYGYLADRLDAPFDRFNENRLTVVTFNYDRSLEWYLFNSLGARFSKKHAEVIRQLSNIPIIHLYGTLGGVPWDSHSRQYDPTLNPKSIRLARDAIKIIHEGERNEEEFDRALNALRTAKRIIFLGFGYNRTNISRLEPKEWKNCGQPIGTAVERTEMENQEAGRLIGHGITFGDPNWDILTFLREMITLDRP